MASTKGASPKRASSKKAAPTPTASAPSRPKARVGESQFTFQPFMLVSRSTDDAEGEDTDEASDDTDLQTAPAFFTAWAAARLFAAST